MIPADIIYRVLHIKYGQSIGTGFTVEVQGRQYLVTAKHIVAAATGAFTLEFLHERAWKSLSVELVGHSQNSDISVLASSQELPGREYKTDLTSASMIYGQDVFFLGYPLGLYGDHPPVLQGYPVPYVKKATLSMFGSIAEPTIILDGINNAGFSGGPVAFQMMGTNEWKIAGAISGYLQLQQPVFDGSHPTAFHHQENTGLIQVAPISHAVELINSNPIGLELS